MNDPDSASTRQFLLRSEYLDYGAGFEMVLQLYRKVWLVDEYKGFGMPIQKLPSTLGSYFL